MIAHIPPMKQPLPCSPLALAKAAAGRANANGRAACASGPCPGQLQGRHNPSSYFCLQCCKKKLLLAFVLLLPAPTLRTKLILDQSREERGKIPLLYSFLLYSTLLFSALLYSTLFYSSLLFSSFCLISHQGSHPRHQNRTGGVFLSIPCFVEATTTTY